uniref:Uncharacterized protein n=1 Tax=Tanacetum cinerariifolium TaxID=118510 RepID=A0A6L2JDG6_TANCI|nr:hypothetical protein [Tanacetum cinerariifolium]
MIPILEKNEHNVDFHPMVDFIEASPLRYALTVKPTVYVSHIPQFWSTARIETTEKGTKILATVDVNEPKSPLRDVSQGDACPINSGFIADQDRTTIAKSSTLPHDSAPRVTSPDADEGKLLAKFQAQELEINRLKDRVKLLEDKERVAAEGSRDDAPIKGRNLDEGEATAERASDDTEEMATVLTSMDAATVLASGAAEVPTGNGSIPTAGPPATEVPTSSDVVPTTSPVFATTIVVTLYRRRKGKEVMQKRDYYMAVIRSNLGWKVKDFRGMTFEEVEGKFNSVWKQIEDFIPIGSKEEAERIKRKGLSLDQESAKKFKPSKKITEEAKSPNKVPEEKIKEMTQLVPIEQVYVEALQVKHPTIDWKVHLEDQRAYWKITRLGGSSASYQFFIDLLKHLDREDLNQL